jgi:hydrogenase nickel incorporation protein HypA/HybF
VHEYSVVQSLMAHVEAHARQHHAVAVRRVFVRIGELSGVEPDLLQTAYDLIKERSLCAEAPLEISSVEARWECRECGRPVARGLVLRCETCGLPARLVAGDEIMLDRVELEVGDV